MWIMIVTSFWQRAIHSLLTKHYKQQNNIGLLTPCNVIVFEPKGETFVSAHLSPLVEPEFDYDDIASIANLLIEQIEGNSPRTFGDFQR